ncbi:MAG: GtrA family protein [Mesorhizobium sp.]|nr:GtrA family protein [Mesorhizobium sp.]
MNGAVIGILRRVFDSQPMRFVMAGVLNTAFGYTLYLIGLQLGFAAEVALGISVFIGALFNYFTTARYVFNHAAMNFMPRFIAAYAVIYGLNVLALRGLILLGLSAALAQGLLLPVAAAASYLIFKFVVFRKPTGS